MNSNTSLSFQYCSSQLMNTYQNLKQLDLNNLKKKLLLHFQVLPTYDEFVKLTQNNKFEEHKAWDRNEELLLQLLALSDNPLCIKNRFHWEFIQKLMPQYRSVEELYFKFQSFYKPNLARLPWSSFEDNLLLTIILEYHTLSFKWKDIADKYNLLCQSQTLRNAKQCRERWNNKLDPKINKNPWTAQEEIYFLTLLLEKGKKWSTMSHLMNQNAVNNTRRTEFALKHKYKQLRKYYGSTAQLDLSKYEINSKWSKSEANMILKKIEFLLNQQAQLCTKKNYRQIQFLLQNANIEAHQIVLIKNGSIHSI